MQLTYRSHALRLRRFARRLARSTSGAILIEFAFTFPILLTLGLFGAELANYMSVRMQVSQIALSIGDNAARIGQTDNSAVTPTVSFSDAKTVLSGGILQGGNINLQANGRIILSSLERDAATGRQYIHWQRCMGALAKASSYGPSGYGLTGTVLPGMGQTGHVITADNGISVMFVEIYYKYPGLLGKLYINEPVFKQEAAFIIRDDRSLDEGLTGTADGTTACT